MDIGFTMLDSTGEEVIVYDHVQASAQEGWMTAEITPSAYEGMENNVYCSPAHTCAGDNEKMRLTLSSN